MSNRCGSILIKRIEHAHLKTKPAIMKKVIISGIAILVFVFSPVFMHNVFADQPPDPGGDPGGPGGGNPVGGGSPIGGGLVVMVVLGAAYGIRKVYDARKDLMN
jgi:hypothetical protein